jgi:hypothetical protein
MDEIKQRYDYVLEGVNSIKDITIDDKIYISENKMYIHKNTVYQKLFRTFTDNSRDKTFTYLENFIIKFNNLQKTLNQISNYLHTEAINNMKHTMPNLKRSLCSVLQMLIVIYPTEILNINNLKKLLV